MASAIGAYATLTDAKARLSIDPTDTTADTLIQKLCDQTNGWIESPSGTGRILAPITLTSTTLASGVSAGATTIPLTSAANTKIGDELVVGPVSGTHESVTVAALSGTTATVQCHESTSGLKNSYLAGVAVTGCYILDGRDALEAGRLLLLRIGLNGISSLEVALVTPPNDTFHLVPASDFFLRPRVDEREPGWPATELWLTDVPTSGNPSPVFLPMMGNVRVVPAGSPGWPAIPDEIAKIALDIVVADYRARAASGGIGSVTVNIDGSRTYERILSSKDWATLRRYRYQRLEIV